MARVNELRTTDVTRVLKTPGAELSQKLYVQKNIRNHFAFLITRKIDSNLFRSDKKANVKLLQKVYL